MDISCIHTRDIHPMLTLQCPHQGMSMVFGGRLRATPLHQHCVHCQGLSHNTPHSMLMFWSRPVSGAHRSHDGMTVTMGMWNHWLSLGLPRSTRVLKQPAFLLLEI